MPEIVRHKKTGGLYEVLFRGATVETDRPLADYDEVIVCRRVSDGGIVIRPANLPVPANRIALYGASVQTNAPLTNGDEAVVYRNQDDDLLTWARSPAEMADGRFETVSATPVTGGSFQNRVDPWLIACFGAVIARDKQERAHRFLEEALELVQAAGCTAHEAHQLVDYVYGRPAGEMAQEVGGVMTTLAAFCLAHGLDMHEAGEAELARIWTRVEKIRAKQAAKPKHSPLPEAPASPPDTPSSQDSGVGESEFAYLVHIDAGAMAIVDQAASKISEERASYQDGFHQGAISAAGRIRSLIRVLMPEFDSRVASLSAPRPSQREG